MTLLKKFNPTIMFARLGLLSQSYLLWTACGFVVAFLLGFLLFFPLEPLARQAERQLAAQADLELDIVRPGWSFPPGVDAERISLTVPELQGEVLQLGDARIAPLWSTLFSGNPGLQIAGRFFSGDLDAEVRRQGDLELTLSGAQLEQQRLSPQLSLRLSGRDGELAFSGRIAPDGTGQGNGRLALDQVELSGMSALGASEDLLTAGNLRLETELNGNALTIRTLELTGGELELSGGGSLLLGARPQLSRLNLSLVLRPQAGLDPQLRDLLTLLATPEADGSIKFRLLGSLAAPQLR